MPKPTTKPAPKSAAKPAKAAPPPVVEEEDEGFIPEVGQQLVFVGYGDDVPEDERLLSAGELYEVAEVNDTDGLVSFKIENPAFNPKKKESGENTREVLVDVLFSEVALPSEEDAAEEEAGEEEAEEEAAEEEAPPPAAKSKAVAKATAKAAPAAKATAKAPAKAAPAAKGKAVAKGKAAPPPPPEEEVEEDKYPALESEDEDILALVTENEADLLSFAAELVEDQNALDYKLGGVLYHMRLSRSYQDIDPEYAEKGGWQKYLDDKLPGLGYRKAMHLIAIYYNVNLLGIDPAKVAELGYTKWSKLYPAMTADNAEELVELAENQSVSELSATIKESYSPASKAAGEKRRKVAFKFRLWEDQAKGVEEVLEHVAKARGLKDISDAFEHIVMEYAAEHPEAMPRKAARKVAAPAAKAGAKPAAKVASKA